MTLQSATYTYHIDNSVYPADNIPKFYTSEEEKSREICNTNDNNTTCPDMVDLSDLVTQGYLPYIPTDPRGSTTPNGTGSLWSTTRSGTHIWTNAMSQCNNLTYAGSSNWHLPNPNQLRNDFGVSACGWSYYAGAATPTARGRGQSSCNPA